MRTLSGVLLVGCFVLGLLLLAMLIVLLRHSVWRFINRQGRAFDQMISDTSFWQEEETKRPAFLSGNESSSLRRW
jgi:hypothetical protein